MILCPDDADLQGLLADRLAEDTRTSVVRHVETCAACQKRLDSLTHADELQLAISHAGSGASAANGPAFLQRLQEKYPSTLMPSEPRVNGTLHFPGPVSDRAPLGEVGDFEILEELGSGTFGWVFRARERSLDRIVALKVLKPEMTARTDALARFEREARKASLKHDHIVCVHRFEKPNGFPPYLVMEFVAGETLEASLKREGKLSPAEAASIARQVALGLAAAHEHGMVHRDIKPANILLDNTSGRAKISDFGLARDIADESMAVTAAGELAGTAPYMSPEHFRTPDKVDGRSDIFSLGIVLYQLLTGQLPFRGSFLQIRSGILEDEPKAPRRLNDGIPADLETITLACLHKDSQRRYASAQAVAEDLRRFQNGEPILCRPTGRVERILKWMQRKPAQAALVGVATIAVAFLAFLIFGIYVNAHLQEVNGELFTAKGELKATNDQLVGEKGQIKKLNYVADMNLAHQAWQNDNFQLLEQYLAPYEGSDERGFEWHYLRWLSRTDGRRFGPKEPVSTLAFDRSGRFLALGVLTGKEAQIQIWQAPTEDKPAGVLLYSLPGQEFPATDLAFHSTSDVLIAADREGTIVLWDYKNGKVTHTIAGNGPLAISSDGESLAYVRLDGAAQRWSFADKRDNGPPLIFAIGSAAEIAGKGRGPAATFERSDKGKMRGGFDKGSMKGRGLEGSDKGKGRGAEAASSSGIEQLAFSADGQRLFVVGGHYKSGGLLAAWDLKRGQRLSFDDARQDDILSCVALSQDGKSIAAAGYDHMLRVWDAATGKLRFRRLAHKLEALTVAFSVKGNVLASAGWDQTIKIWNAATGEEVSSLHGNRGIVRRVAFAPRPGRDRLVSLNDLGELRWWDPTEEQTARVTRLREPVHALAFSPQGRYLASFGRGSQALVQDLTRPGQRQELGLSSAGARGVFSQDETTLFIAAGNDLVQSWTFARVGPSMLPRPALISGQRLLVSDGKQWLVSQMNPSAQEPLKHFISFGAPPSPLPTIVAIDTSAHQLAYVGGNGRIMIRQRDKSGGIAAEKALPSDGGRAGVNTLSFSPDGSLLASGSQDNSILLWDVPSGSVRHHLTGHLCFVSCVAFSPDGRRLASGSEDWTVKKRSRAVFNPFTEVAEDDSADSVLVKQAICGDRAAREKLVLRHQAWVYNIAVRMVFKPQDAEEVTQEVLVKVITKLSTFKGESTFRTWLYRIAANHVLNMKRRWAETRTTTFADYGAAIDGTLDLDLPDPNSVPVEVPLLVEEAKNSCTMGMLLCLDRKQRLIFTLGAILGASDTVGGEVLEMTAGNFRQCLARARRDLHSFMNNQCGLVNKNNPCRCHKKTRGFIEEGHVDPHDLMFVPEHRERVREVAPETVREIEDVVERQHVAIYRDHPFLQPPDQVEWLSRMLESGDLRKALRLN